VCKRWYRRCILFGMGTLVWQQVITTIPIGSFGKSME
jgi:hypothetical protein